MKRRGFTFIELELLVVVAIITILAVFLWPVFTQSQEKARVASCQYYLKQIHKAVTLYMSDYDNHFPFWISSVGRKNYTLRDSLWKYGRASEDIWLCPSDQYQGSVNFVSEKISYVGNLKLLPISVEKTSPPSLSSIPFPKITPMLFDGYSQGKKVANMKYGPDARHIDQVVNVLTVDGSVKPHFKEKTFGSCMNNWLCIPTSESPIKNRWLAN